MWILSASLDVWANRTCARKGQTEDRAVIASPALDAAFKSASHAGRALTVREIGALSHLDNVTIRIADVTAYLAVLGDRLGDELGASTFP